MDYRPFVFGFIWGTLLVPAAAQVLYELGIIQNVMP